MNDKDLASFYSFYSVYAKSNPNNHRLFAGQETPF